MNTIHWMIATTCRGCVADSSFTYEQRTELLNILEKFENIKVSNIWKFTKLLKKFEDKFTEFGGDHAMLEARIQKIRDDRYLAAAKVVPGIKIVKKGE